MSQLPRKRPPLVQDKVAGLQEVVVYGKNQVNKLA